MEECCPFQSSLNRDGAGVVAVFCMYILLMILSSSDLNITTTAWVSSESNVASPFVQVWFVLVRCTALGVHRLRFSLRLFFEKPGGGHSYFDVPCAARFVRETGYLWKQVMCSASVKIARGEADSLTWSVVRLVRRPSSLAGCCCVCACVVGLAAGRRDTLASSTGSRSSGATRASG